MRFHYYSAKRAIEIENGVTEIIRAYHLALDNREHGDVAKDKAIKAIEALLDEPYRTGLEKKRQQLRELEEEIDEQECAP